MVFNPDRSSPHVDHPVRLVILWDRKNGKQHLGIGNGQLRTAKGQTRHLYLVMLAHSLLIDQMGQGHARGWAHSVLTTIGQACRAVSRETLSKTIHWAVEQANHAGVESATDRRLP